MGPPTQRALFEAATGHIDAELQMYAHLSHGARDATWGHAHRADFDAIKTDAVKTLTEMGLELSRLGL